MPFRHHDFSALVIVDPDEARRQIKKAFVHAFASRWGAARRLGVSRATLRGWTKRLGLDEWLTATEKIAKRDGWHHHCHRGGIEWEKRKNSSREPERRPRD